MLDRSENADEWLWVVVGDVPSACLVLDDVPNPTRALISYCDLMEDWIDAISTGSNMSEVYPVDAPADEQHAEMLEGRLQFIRREILRLPRGGLKPPRLRGTWHDDQAPLSLNDLTLHKTILGSELSTKTADGQFAVEPLRAGLPIRHQLPTRVRSAT